MVNSRAARQPDGICGMWLFEFCNAKLAIFLHDGDSEGCGIKLEGKKNAFLRLNGVGDHPDLEIV